VGIFLPPWQLDARKRRLKRNAVERGQMVQQAQRWCETRRPAQDARARERIGNSAKLRRALTNRAIVFPRKLVSDCAQFSVEAGSPVIDDIGVVGQVTRVFPYRRCTLAHDKDQTSGAGVARPCAGSRSAVSNPAR